MSEDAYMGGIQYGSGQGVTSEWVVARFESVRTFCLNAIVGDPLAFAFGVDPGMLVTVEGTPTTPVEFTAQTMAALMTEAIALVQRLESRADGAEEWCRAERQTGESLGEFNAILERDNTTLRRALGVPLGAPLPTWVQRYAENSAETVTKARTPQPGDMCTDRDGRRWVVPWTRTDGVLTIWRTDGPQGGPLSDMEELSGPMVWDTPEPASVHESDGETSPGTPTPEDGGYAAYAAPMDAEDRAVGRSVRARRRVETDSPESPEDGSEPLVVRAPLPMGLIEGDACTDACGRLWVARTSDIDGIMRMYGDDGAAMNPDRLEGAHGPLVWHARDTDGSAGTGVPETSGDDDTAPWVPSVGDVCTDRDGDIWAVTRMSHAMGPMLRGDSHVTHSMEYVVKTWGPLRWNNGHVTEGS